MLWFKNRERKKAIKTKNCVVGFYCFPVVFVNKNLCLYMICSFLKERSLSSKLKHNILVAVGVLCWLLLRLLCSKVMVMVMVMVMVIVIVIVIVILLLIMIHNT